MSSKKIKLYYHPISQPSRSIFMFMKKNGIDADYVVVDILSGEHKTDEMLKKNPFGAVPFIEYKKKSGGKEEVLTESTAILTYLIANKKLKEHWYPSDKELRSKVDQYLNYHPTGIRQALVRAFLYETFMKQQMGQQYGEKKILEDMDMEVGRLGTMFLKGKQFLASDKDISIADLLAFNEVAQMSLTQYGDTMLDKYPDVKQWYGRVKSYFKAEYDEVYGALNKLAAAFPKPTPPVIPTLYYDPLSQPSRTLVMFVKKMGIDCEFKVVNLIKGENKSDEITKLNPMQAVPFLNYKSESGENDVYTESTAIIGLLCDLNSGVKVDDHWFPRDEKKHAKIAAYLSYHSTGIRQALVRVFLHSTFMKEDMEKKYGVKQMQDDMKKELDRLENHFIREKGKFIYSDEISVADIFAANEIGQLIITSYWKDLFNDRPILECWYKRVHEAMNPHFDELYNDFQALMGKPAAAEQDTAL